MFITHFKINHVRHLENLEIALSTDKRKHLILTGKNGSGKTSVLEAVRDFLVAYESRPFSPVFAPVKMVQKVALEFNALDDLTQLSQHDEFILAFFADKRGTSMDIPQGPKKIPLKTTLYNITNETKAPSDIFLQYLVNLKVEQSFARDDGEFDTVNQIEKWFNQFEGTLQELFEDDRLKLQFDRKNYNFELVTRGRKPFDFNTLSDGYSAVVNIISDLIVRMEHQKTEGYDLPGIVLIDEIETHLHVELQKKILPFLTRFFPEIQFIVSTHSPFVLTSLTDAVIYDLENQYRFEDLSPYSYEAVVERYFEIDKYSNLSQHDGIKR
jgi:predicted ATPase